MRREQMPPETEDDESDGFLSKLKKGAIKWGLILGVGALILAAI